MSKAEHPRHVENFKLCIHMPRRNSKQENMEFKADFSITNSEGFGPFCHHQKDGQSWFKKSKRNRRDNREGPYSTGDFAVQFCARSQIHDFAVIQ
jgi:hypothetical protein